MTDTAQWVTLLTVIVGFVYQAYTTARQRRWEREDRAVLAADVAESARQVARTVASSNAALGEKIDINTEISTKAFHEANSVNLKIEKLGLEHNQLQREQQSNGDKGET